MITYIVGDIFQSSAQVLTNPVNCVGVMGKGLALEFKNRYPNLLEDYKARCNRNEVRLGVPYLWENDSVQILNFPTKRDWKENSVLKYIEDGLKYLAENYQKMGIQSLAMPPLGCGLGGLEWSEVYPLIEKYLRDIPDLEVYVYESEALRSLRNANEKELERRLKDDSGIAASSP